MKDFVHVSNGSFCDLKLPHQKGMSSATVLSIAALASDTVGVEVGGASPDGGASEPVAGADGADDLAGFTGAPVGGVALRLTLPARARNCVPSCCSSCLAFSMETLPPPGVRSKSLIQLIR